MGRRRAVRTEFFRKQQLATAAKAQAAKEAQAGGAPGGPPPQPGAVQRPFAPTAIRSVLVSGAWSNVFTYRV